MKKKRGFTLIELLVVIAVIALLMSILIPALSKVRKHAMSLVCQSRLKQWGVIFSIYTGQNDGYFLAREIGTEWGYQRLWHMVYKPYYINPKMRFCPTAENPNIKTGPFGTWNPDKGMWDPEDYPVPGEGDDQTGLKAPTGSYGVNRYIENMKGGTTADNPSFFRRADAKGGDKVPAMLDCQYVYYWPDADAEPPAYNGDYTTPEMHWICIDRHMGSTNAVYLDSSVRKTGLKELWVLKQSKTFNVCGPWSICGFGGNKFECASAWDAIAAWMSKMPEY